MTNSTHTKGSRGHDCLSVEFVIAIIPSDGKIWGTLDQNGKRRLQDGRQRTDGKVF
jgi:hypothetical protein